MDLSILCDHFPFIPTYISEICVYLRTLNKVGKLVNLNTRYLLKLFVAGTSIRTGSAIANLRRICEGEFPGCYELVVIDVMEQPAIAEQENILAVPTLVKEFPLPVRRIIGDLSSKEKVLAGIGLLSHLLTD